MPILVRRQLELSTPARDVSEPYDAATAKGNDMTAKKPTPGGKRKGAGRPKSTDKMGSVTIRLTKDQHTYAYLLGREDVSKGVRELIDEAQGVVSAGSCRE